MIRTRGLSKRFKPKRQPVVEAVTNVDIDVQPGEMVAFLGPNGAGKSTTLRMLTTLLRPTSGEAEVVGYDVARDPEGVRRRIGYIGQGNGAGHYYRVQDELVTQGQCYGMSRAEAASRALELLTSLDLRDLATRNVETLSGGQRRRLDIAMGLMHRPPLLFLDEPSTGLDPQNRANLAEHIVRLRQEYGTTIVLTTHYLDEADAMAERVMIIDHGRIIADDSPSCLKAQLAGDLITLVLAERDDVEAAYQTVRPLAESVELDLVSSRMLVRANQGDVLLPEIVRRLDATGVMVQAAELRRPTLDDVFLTLTGRSLREEEAAA